MKVEVSKKKLKITILVVIAIIILVGMIFLIKTIFNNIQISNSKETLSQINAEELQEQLINELENSSSVIVNTAEITTTIGTSEEINNSSFKLLISFLGIAESNNEDTSAYNGFEDFVFAFYTDNGSSVENSENIVAVPLFKVESDDNGNFKSIEYNRSLLYNYKIPTIIKDFLEKQYNVDVSVLKFNTGTTEYNNLKIVNFGDDDFKLELMKTIVENNNVTFYEECYDLEDDIYAIVNTSFFEF